MALTYEGSKLFVDVVECGKFGFDFLNKEILILGLPVRLLEVAPDLRHGLLVGNLPLHPGVNHVKHHLPYFRLEIKEAHFV